MEETLQWAHIVLFQSPRDINQIEGLGQQLGKRNVLPLCYKDATSKPFGFLMIDLSPKKHWTFYDFVQVWSQQFSLYPVKRPALQKLTMTTQQVITLLQHFKSLSPADRLDMLKRCEDKSIFSGRISCKHFARCSARNQAERH